MTNKMLSYCCDSRSYSLRRTGELYQTGVDYKLMNGWYARIGTIRF